MTKYHSLSQQRREEIFRAAHKCFVSRGFHATSMTDIAREFGMSVGHVYNYFPSKQAIIEGLIEQGIEDFYINSSELMASSSEGDFDVVREAVKKKLLVSHDKDQVRLTLELLVEATHDTKLSNAIVEADKKVRAHLRDLHHSQGECTQDETRIEILMAMFEGLGLRVLRNPEIDMDRIYDEVALRLFKPRLALERQVQELQARNAELEAMVEKLKAK